MQGNTEILQQSGHKGELYKEHTYREGKIIVENICLQADRIHPAAIIY